LETDRPTDGPTDATKRIQYSPPHILWWGYNKSYLLKHVLENTKVALVTGSVSMRPAGIISSSPSGLNVSRRKNERIVSSWNMRNDLGFESFGESLSFSSSLAGFGVCTLGRLIFLMVCIHVFVLMLYTRHDLQ